MIAPLAAMEPKAFGAGAQPSRRSSEIGGSDTGATSRRLSGRGNKRISGVSVIAQRFDGHISKQHRWTIANRFAKRGTARIAEVEIVPRRTRNRQPQIKSTHDTLSCRWSDSSSPASAVPRQSSSSPSLDRDAYNHFGKPFDDSSWARPPIHKAGGLVD